ncbi:MULTISPECIES: hypothetical protein [unclassified Duganella]|uniref:hypothetical protein n=1 Tax=unclassified Duganella TaxID=2636909 RepID=UPI0012E36F2A|nr:MULTISPECIES: hypothetical protein [unclassified Duganella]
MSLTPRLLAVGLCGVLALLVLLFALGFQVGLRMSAQTAEPPQVLAAAPQAFKNVEAATPPAAGQESP